MLVADRDPGDIRAAFVDEFEAVRLAIQSARDQTDCVVAVGAAKIDQHVALRTGESGEQRTHFLFVEAQHLGRVVVLAPGSHKRYSSAACEN